MEEENTGPLGTYLRVVMRANIRLFASSAPDETASNRLHAIFGFSHQDPGFLDVVTNKSPSITRVYLPPDANCLLAVADECLRSTDCINVIVADKQRHLQCLPMEEAVRHVAKGIGIWDWASNDDHGTQPDIPDVVVTSCGDVATKEALRRHRHPARGGFPTSRCAS